MMLLDDQTEQQKPISGFLLLPILLLITLVMVVSSSVSWNWVQIPVHSVVEVVGGLSLMVLVLLFASNSQEEVHSGGLWFCAGLFCMGLADLMHALVEPGNLFVWFHSLAIFSGGVLAAGSWFASEEQRSVIKIKTILILTFSLLLLGVVSAVFSDFVPEMLAQGLFTPLAWVLNISGGTGFLLAAVWLWRWRARFQKGQLLIFISLCLLNASAGLLFKYSQVWNFDWWLWHLLRLIASLVALAYLAYLLRQVFLASGERDHLKSLLNQVHEQQAALQAISVQREEKGQLHEALLGAADLQQVGDHLLQNIARVCLAQVGAFYIAGSDGGFTLSGSYAYPDVGGPTDLFPPGEGLISAAAREKKPLFITDIPEGYMRVEAGTYTRQLQQLCLYPFVHQTEVVAVAEFGLTSPLTASALAFLAEIETTVTATVLAAKR